jgi:acetaldehyde/propanal dehydrogenase
MGAKIKAAVVGSGNIGTDLMEKALRSEWIDPVWVVGIDPASDGLARAGRLGLETTSQGIDGLLPHLDEDGIRIVFDATSAHAHLASWRKLESRGVLVIDLTPAAVGPYCIPPVNLRELVGSFTEASRTASPPGAAKGPLSMNVNMVSCGGQATVPIVAAVSRVQPVAYAEIVATVASRSIGPGTRQNIDEFTRTTARAVERIGGAAKGKAIIVVNPAEPPLLMRDTIHCLTETDPDERAIAASIHAMIAEVGRYVPGYRLKNGPVFDGRRVSVFLEVEGLGDYLPKYAGNLDIMTAAALRTAEMLAQAMAAGTLRLGAAA